MITEEAAAGRSKESFREALGRVDEGILDELRIDRTGIDGDRVVPIRAKAAAWGAIIGLYVLGWGGGVQTAVAVAFNWIPVIEVWPVPPIDDQITSLVRKLAVVVLAAALIWAFRQYAGARVRAATWRTSIKTFPVGYLAPLVGFSFASLLNSVFGFQDNELEVPPIDNPLQRVLGILTTGMAGPTEELGRVSQSSLSFR